MMAIIPAKTFSERIPGKNLRLLNGVPLIQYTINAAIESKCFDTIWISSESYDFLKTIPKGTEGHLRPKALAEPTSTVVDVCRDLLRVYVTNDKYDWQLPDSFCVLLPTSPLRKSSDIVEAIELFEQSKCEAVMTVCELEHPPEHSLRICERNRLHPCSWATIDQKRQNFEPKYRHDGSIIICNTQSFLAVGDFYDLDIVPMKMERSVDINTMDDWKYCEYLMGEK